jgi:hypothetical protein
MDSSEARNPSVEIVPSCTGLSEGVVLQRLGQIFVAGFDQEGLVVENYYRRGLGSADFVCDISIVWVREDVVKMKFKTMRMKDCSASSPVGAFWLSVDGDIHFRNFTVRSTPTGTLARQAYVYGAGGRCSEARATIP